MNAHPKICLQSPVAMTGKSITVVVFGFLGSLLFVILLVLFLMSNFPAYFSDTGIFVSYALIWVLWIAIAISLWRQRIWMESGGACVTVFGKPSWGMNHSQLRMIALVGNDAEDVLCLSAHSMEQLAAMRERQLLKNWFSKDEVPLRKRRPDWQERFAGEYILLGQKKSIFASLQKNGLILLPANLILLTCIRWLYPAVPYYNLSLVGQERVGLEYPENVPGVIGMDYSVSLQADGVHLLRGNKERAVIPASQIKTVVKVHFFNPNSKYYRHYTPILMVSTRSVEELAAVAPRILYGVTVERLPLNSEMLATVYCDRQVVRWNGRDLTICPIYSTKEHKMLLQEYCPHARWVDIGGVIENK